MKKVFFTLFLCIGGLLMGQPRLLVKSASMVDNRLQVNIIISAEGKTIHEGGYLTAIKWRNEYADTSLLNAAILKAIRLQPQEEIILLINISAGNENYGTTVSSLKKPFKEYLKKMAGMKNPSFKIEDAYAKESRLPLDTLSVTSIQDTAGPKVIQIEKVELAEPLRKGKL